MPSVLAGLDMLAIGIQMETDLKQSQLRKSYIITVPYVEREKPDT